MKAEPSHPTISQIKADLEKAGILFETHEDGKLVIKAKSNDSAESKE